MRKTTLVWASEWVSDKLGVSHIPVATVTELVCYLWSIIRAWKKHFRNYMFDAEPFLFFKVHYSLTQRSNTRRQHSNAWKKGWVFSENKKKTDDRSCCLTRKYHDRHMPSFIKTNLNNIPNSTPALPRSMLKSQTWLFWCSSPRFATIPQ
jgi:hypothetical protein